jgi:hypothetical protein
MPSKVADLGKSALDLGKELRQPLMCRASFEVLECIKESSMG